MSRIVDRIAWHRRLHLLCALCSALLCCPQVAPALSGSDEVPVFMQEPLSVVQKLGGSVTLRCSARPAEAHISWRLNGRELFTSGDEAELGIVMQSDALFIASLSNGTLGRYQCVASNGAGARASVPANVTAAKLRDFEPDDQQEIEVDEGNTAVIECHLPESQPQAQVRYSIKQEWLETSKGNYLIMPSGNLQIANATQDDEGPYKCAAYNPVTQEIKTSTSTDRLRIRRSTSEAARIIYPPASRSMTVLKGHRLVLECVASGSPIPQVTWAKDGRELSPQNNTRFLLSNLLIDAVSDEDSGKYACHAHNGMGSPGTATILYEVQVIEPPQVRVELLQQEPAWGDTVKFSCQVRGNPTPSVVWLHNAQPISSSSRHRLTSSHMLRVFSVGPQDEGVYQCMAENWVGGAQAATRLVTVPSAPSRPGRLPLIRPMSPDQVLRELPPARPVAPSTDLFVDCSEIPGNVSPAEAPVILSQPRTGTADYYELIWEPRHDGGAPVLEYVVKYRKAGDSLSEWTIKNISGLEQKLILAKLQPASLYEVEMSARNCAGLGQPAMMTFRTGRKTVDRPKPPDPPLRLSPPEAPDRPTVTTASETSAYVTWIPRGNRGFPIQCFRVEFKKLRKDGGAGGEWEVAEDNISPSRLSVQIKGLEKGTSYKFRVLAVNVLGASPPSAPSKAYTVMGSNQTNPRPVDGPYITYSEAINETTIILKWTYTSVNNTPIYGFYIYYRPTDSDNDSDYKRDVVEGDRYWHAMTSLQPETAYDIKMQCFNEGGVSEFGNVVILETKARPNQKHTTPETSSPQSNMGNPGTPRPSDLPYLIVGVVVLGALVFIIIAFIPFCLWRAWAKQKQTTDMCFPAVAAPLSSCQYTMVPMQGMALVGHCPVDPHLTPGHTVYAAKGEYMANGKNHTHHGPGLHQDDAECEMENGTFMPQRLSNGHAHGYHYPVGVPGHVEDDGCCEPDDSTLELLSPDHPDHAQENHAIQSLDLSLLPRLEADGMMTTVTTQREDVKIQREGRLEERVLQDG
ncbi:brother of CDO isoform 2-T2 [Clarias gariepinus]|uniref:brother of CDO isoform X2 n=1 Tax=Clarias gariepinus TaxID=13013 RepID=UPI00234CC557|nr:brother of CDO isoform X2 [Clarias gariepinus]